MTSITTPYRLSVAVALLGVALVAVVMGRAEDRQHCRQSQRATAVVSADLVSTRSPALDQDAAHHARSFVDAEQVSTPRPECDSDFPAEEFRAASTPPVRLTDHDEGGHQQTTPLLLHDVRAFGESQFERPVSSPLVSRAQGTLGTVRSVVLRL